MVCAAFVFNLYVSDLPGQISLTVYFSIRFVGTYSIDVNGEEFSAEKIFINVGARPFIPEGLKNTNFPTNQSILDLEDVPEHLTIVAGNYIGLEFGQMFRRFVSKVTIIEKSDRIISREDEDVSHEIRKVMEREGAIFHLNAECIPSREEKDGRFCRLPRHESYRKGKGKEQNRWVHSGNRR